MDAAFIAIHLGLSLLILAGVIRQIPLPLNIARDWSLPEIFNYLKWIAVLALLWMAWRCTGGLLFLAVALVFVIALADDALQLHETQSAEFAALLNVDLVQHKRWHELVVWIGLGLAAGGPLLLAWLTATPTIRRLAAPLLLLFGLVVFCAVGIDFIHERLPGRTVMAGILGVLEDGGEMVSLSLLLAYASALRRRLPTG